MANITRFDPFEDLARFQPLAPFDDFFKGFRMRPWVSDVDVEPRIKVDVAEEEKSYAVKADIPGVKKEDIHVAIDGNQVSIEAEVKKEKEEKKGEKVVRSERYYGSLYRSFSLGHDVDESAATAKFTDGTLELVLPKKATSAVKTLAIH